MYSVYIMQTIKYICGAMLSVQHCCVIQKMHFLSIYVMNEQVTWSGMPSGRLWTVGFEPTTSLSIGYMDTEVTAGVVI